jgi:hypothetical protein
VYEAAAADVAASKVPTIPARRPPAAVAAAAADVLTGNGSFPVPPTACSRPEYRRLDGGNPSLERCVRCAHRLASLAY